MLEKLFGRRGNGAKKHETISAQPERLDANNIEVHEHMHDFLSFASATRCGTIRGEAKENEDSVVIGKNHLAVADGMGGHEAGKEASRTIIEMFDYAFKDQTPLSLDQWMKRGERFIAEANSRMQQLNDEAGRNTSGTTFTGVVLETQPVLAENDYLERVAETKEKSGEIFGMLLHVGDSRAYILDREGNFKKITTDEDSLYAIVRSKTPETETLDSIRLRVREMQESLEGLSHDEKLNQLRDAYDLTEEEIELYDNNVQSVSSAFGIAVEEDPFITFFQLRPGETLMIQSDGLDVLTNEERKAIIEHALDEAYAAEALVARAMEKVQENRASGKKTKDDDMTVALVRNTFEPIDADDSDDTATNRRK